MKSAETLAADRIAIIGMGCRFPGGVEDPQSFWELLKAGTDAVGDIPADRWQAESYFDAEPSTPGRMFVRQAAFLHGSVDGFDAGFFGMTPREAAPLDPQQRLLLEVTWEAFEDAGLRMSEHTGANVGAYIGGFTFDAATLQLNEANRDLVSAATPTGVSMTMLAARLAYTFDWRGPALTIDTACSSSLVALHQACTALINRECDLAVAGGVNMMINPVTSILMSKGQFLSPDARCKSFDHRANGYVRGEGAGILVLKPLTAAQRDGDRIHAIIRGTAVNQDGHTPGITVPSGPAQQAVIRRACQVGAVDPRTIGYFEAHGTGTAVGDPIEATAIGEVLEGSSRTHWLGSVKSNIGHTEAAAGVAAVIKAVLCLQRGQIPGNLHFERANPKIPFDRLPLRVPTQMVPFDRAEGPRRAGVNSFGFGGTNAHAVLEEPPSATDPAPVIGAGSWPDEPVLLPLSARSPAALGALVENYAKVLDSPGAPALREVGAAAARNRDHHPVRTFVIAADPAEAVRELQALIQDGAPALAQRVRRKGTCFVYTGMGPQWWGMGRELLRHETVFADTVRACDEILSQFGLSIAEEFARNEESSRLTRTLYAQVGNFVLQAGLTALHREWGRQPEVIVGHSVGEVASTYAAGVYSLEDALTISYHRAHLQSRLAGRGAMAAVNLAAPDVEPYLNDAVSVAAINSAASTTLAGDPTALDGVVEALRADGAVVKPLRVDVAYHSPQMDEIREPLLEALRDLRPQVAHTPLYSTVTGERVSGPELDAGYWWRNVRQPVRFAAAFRALLTHEPGTITEVGPHPVLATAMDEALTESGLDADVIASQRRDRPQRRQLRQALGAAYTAGATLDWTQAFPGPRPHPRLPSYPWQRERYWLESTASRTARLGHDGSWLTGRRLSAPEPIFETQLSPARFPYLADHRIGDTIVFPGSGYLDAALGLFPDEQTCVLRDIVFQRPLTVAPRSIPTLRTSYDPDTHRVNVQSRSSGQEAWTLHAHLHHPEISVTTPAPHPQTLDELTADLPARSHDEVYAMLDASRLNYGPAFRSVLQLWHRPETGEVFAELDAAVVPTQGHRLHPATLDAALQAMIVGALEPGGGPHHTYVPARIDEFRFFRPPGKQLWLHGRDQRGPETDRLQCDLTLVTDGGEIVAELVGLHAQRLDDPGEGPNQEEPIPQGMYYRYRWSPQPLPTAGAVGDIGEAPDATGEWVVVGPSVLGRAIAEGLTGRGGRAVHIRPTGDWLDQVAMHVSRSANCRGVILLIDDPAGAAARTAVCEEAVTQLLPLVQALTATPVPLTVLTRATQTVTDDDVTSNPFTAAAWGLARVVNAERPELRCRLIDLDPDVDAAIVPLLDELTHDESDDVALRAGIRYVRRIERAEQRSPVHHLRVVTRTTPVRLHADSTAVDDLHFVATDGRVPDPGEVEIDVSHVGLNFKDLLKVTGLLSREAMEGTHSQQTLGFECSGTIVRVGADVREFKPGDEVFAHSRDLFASRVTLDQVRVVRRPAELSPAEAASLLPVVTAYHSLVNLARVRPGERVLVHSAAGGVGLAAVRLAHRLGAVVYATAGTEERRAFLRQEGVAGVTDSRWSGFADDIRQQSHGEGVDVVINSLPGEMLHESLRLLRPFGRFVELGKADIVADRALRLATFHRSLSFHTFDYDQLMHLHPELTRRGMEEVADLFRSRALEPLPVLDVPAADVAAGFRAMAHREHIGKIVVRTRNESVMVPAASVPERTIRSEGTYVITGGLGGLGLTVARWLVECGARHLVLIGRRGVTSESTRSSVAELTALGAQVRIEPVDVIHRDRVAAALDRVRAEMPPLRGIIHAAADFDDVVLAASDPRRLVGATGPKADGAWNLHLETAEDELDFFVLFSSVAAQLGSAGAGAYVTANEFLNALARYRNGLGLPATSIGWGVIAEVGAVEDENEKVGAVLRRNGHVGMPPARFIAELAVVLKTRPVEVSVADIRWPRWATRNPQLAALPRYTELIPARSTAADGSPDSAAGLGEASREQRLNALPGLLSPLLQRVTGLSAEQLADDQSVDIDSLSAVELRTLLHTVVGVSVAAIRLQQNLTLDGLTVLLADELERARAQDPVAIATHEFVSADGLTVHGHLSLPAAPGPHPVVVVCTAGTGGALDPAGQYRRISEHAPLTSRGFAVFTVDQRGAPGHGDEYAALAEMGGGDIDDVVAAARYVAGLEEIDEGRVNILGTSRGVYSALLAMSRDSSLWHRAVLLMGLYDPAHLVEVERSHPGTLLPEGATVSWTQFENYLADEQRQPLAVLEAVRTPLLVVHGDADDVIPHKQAAVLVDQAGRLGLPTRLTTVPGLGHDDEHTDPIWATLWPQIAEFLNADAS